MFRRTAIAALLALAASAQAQTAPTGSVANPLLWDIQAYTGTARIGSGAINDNNTLFFVKEQRIGNEQSWMVFADPTSTVQISAMLDFGAPVLNVITTTAALVAGHASWGADVDSDRRFNDYSMAATNSQGLEASTDSVFWTSGQTSLTLQWRTAANGDGMRVITAIPEPSTYVLLALGLVAIGLQLSRRKAR